MRAYRIVGEWDIPIQINDSWVGLLQLELTNHYRKHWDLSRLYQPKPIGPTIRNAEDPEPGHGTKQD